MLSLVSLGSFHAHGQGVVWSVNRGASIGWTMGGGPLESWQIAFDHTSDRFWSTPPSANPATRLFAMNLTTNDSGRTFRANALNEPGFAGFVAGLTDGVNAYIRFQATSAWEV